jgi:cytochrome c553
MRLILAISIGFLPMLASFANAEGSAEAGKELYATCAVCHGADGAGSETMKAAPRINHLGSPYLVAQLQKFKAGIRGGEGASKVATQMAAMAAPLADEQAMQDVAAYVSTLAGTASAITVEGDLEAGGNQFKQICGACHGMAGEGNSAMNSPRLAGTDDWYLVDQLNAFRTGTRGSNPSDVTGMQMRGMAGVLADDAAINNVSAYIRSLQE